MRSNDSEAFNFLLFSPQWGVSQGPHFSGCFFFFFLSIISLYFHLATEQDKSAVNILIVKHQEVSALVH